MYVLCAGLPGGDPEDRHEIVRECGDDAAASPACELCDMALQHQQQRARVTADLHRCAHILFLCTCFYLSLEMLNLCCNAHVM